MHHESPVRPEPITLNHGADPQPHTLNVAPEPLKAPPKGSVHLPGEDELKDEKDAAKKKGKEYAKKAKVRCCVALETAQEISSNAPCRRSCTRPSRSWPHTGRRQRISSSDRALSVVSWVSVSCI